MSSRRNVSAGRSGRAVTCDTRSATTIRRPARPSIGRMFPAGPVPRRSLPPTRAVEPDSAARRNRSRAPIHQDGPESRSPVLATDAIIVDRRRRARAVAPGRAQRRSDALAGPIRRGRGGFTAVRAAHGSAGSAASGFRVVQPIPATGSIASASVSLTIASAHAERARPAPGCGDVAGVAAPELDRLLGTGQDTEGRYRPRELSQGDDHPAPASASAAPSGCDGTACTTTRQRARCRPITPRSMCGPTSCRSGA